MWTRLTPLLMLALVSAKPAPEISLQEIEKELEELTAKEHDASEITVKETNQADTPKETKSGAIDTKQKKEEEVKKDVETEKKKSDHLEILPKKPSKPGPEEIPHRDATESDFKDSEAYKRLLEARNSRLLSQLREEYENDYPHPPRRPKIPEAPHRRTYGNTDYNEYDPSYVYPPVPRIPHFPEAPHRRTYDAYHKSYDYVPKDLYEPWDRTGFESNSDQSAGMRRMPYDMTRAERMALLSGGKWLPDSRAVKVPAVLPLRGPSGLTETEKRKRLLTDLLAEKLKSKVSEAHKRGIEIPSKIQEFLWNYEARRTADTRSEKDRLSH